MGDLLQSADSGSFTTNASGGVVTWFDSVNTVGDGTLMVLTVKINDNAQEGQYQIQASLKDGNETNFVDENSQAIPLTFSAGTVTVASPLETKLTVFGSPVTAAPGSTIAVPVMISGGADFAGFTLTVDGSDGLTLTKIEKGALLKAADGMFTPNAAQNVVNWTSSTNIVGNGELLVLTFNVGETVADGSDLTISVALKDGKVSNFGDADEKPVGVKFEDITVTVQTAICGDVNSDGEVDAIDSIRLAKYLVDLVELTPQQILAADVNHDDDITATDAIRLAKYLVGLVDTLRVSPAPVTRAAHRGGSAQITVGTVTAAAGNTVKVPVTISNNPGFAGYTMVITAADGLTLTNIEKGALLNETDGMFTKNVAQSRINWTSSENVTGDGELMYLTFAVSDSAAAGDYAISLALKDGKESNFASIGEAALPAAFCGGTVTLQSSTGDTPEETAQNTPFADMPEASHWSYEPISWATANGITSGISDMTFGLDEACTRAQVVTFLWRAAGSPEPEATSNPFKDLERGAYYYKAVLWAVENDITAGTSATTFSPDETCTRGQIVTLLWRYEGKPETKHLMNPFKDVVEGAYYENAVLWASETGVTAGTSASTFDPESTCTRAQIVTFLYRNNAD